MATYKETMKDKIRLVKLQLGDDYGDTEVMEEAIYKAGIKEVVEWINANSHTYINDDGSGGGVRRRGMCEMPWQAKLKEWGI